METQDLFKDASHEINFYHMMAKLEVIDHCAEAFCYMASAIGRETIIESLEDGYIDPAKLEEISADWSMSHRASLEMAFQIYAHCNLFCLGDEPEFPTVHDLFVHMDSYLIEVAMNLLTRRYQFVY